MMKVGGLGPLKEVDDTIVTILKNLDSELKQKIAEKRGVELETGVTVEPHSYKTQLVAGTNFFVKIKLAEGDFVHARIYRNLQGELSLHGVTESKSETDEIVHF